MFSIQHREAKYFVESYHIPHYSIFLLKEEGQFSINFVNYQTEQNSILFLSPYQNLKWLGNPSSKIQSIEFHGDFYCLEYHKREVACNGLLFNNIYSRPFILLNENTYHELIELTKKMAKESQSIRPFSDSVVKSYLQLILAICSKEKVSQIDNDLLLQPIENEILKFQQLMEKHFIQHRSPSFYASALKMSSSSFSKKVKYQFGKTPTQLIQERVVLEAKKLLHLTHQSIKEIANTLHFDDEFYFSRYFKNEVGLSPSHFRENVGISIVAK